MGDDSFDPRSWGKPGEKPVNGAANGVEKPEAPPVVEPAPPPPEESALPEAWRGIGTAFEPKPAASAKPSAAPGKLRNLAPLLASAALLLAGGTGAWLTRSPPILPADSAPVAEASEAAPGAMERTLVLAGVGDIVAALTAAGVPADQAQAAAQAAAAVLTTPGEIHAVISLMPEGKGFTLQKLQASYADGSGAIIARNDSGGFAGTSVAAELTKQVKVLRGELDSDSFYSSAVTAGVLDTLIPEFINAFGYDFNLAADVKPGDTFEVAYEQTVNANGDPVGQPQLMFASLTTAEKSLALYRFIGSDGEVGWYDGNGGSTKRGLMRTPVDGARISSKFGMRFHPVLHYNKLHRGTDFAAPTGTPIYAAADATVEWAAMKGANGNLTVLKHDNGWRTLYLHQSRFMDGVVAGARVKQGQHIGDIGTTGRSTGPHLHYEVHIDGEPVDPQAIKTDESEKKRLEGAAIQAFMRQRDRVDVARSQQAI